MSDLKLASLRIQNFRTFKDLTINRLGRVNLIVGKNNVGKTAFLRAAWMWAHPEYWEDLSDFLYNEYPGNDRRKVNKRMNVISKDFHGFPKFTDGEASKLRIGPKDESNGGDLFVEFNPKDKSISIKPGFPESDNSKSKIKLQINNKNMKYGPVNRSEFNYVPSSRINIEDAGRLWDEAIRSNLKRRVLATLRLTVPEVEDVNWIKEPSLDTTISGSTLRRDTASDEDRVPMITLKGREKAVPLSSFGEGTERTLWIGSAIVNSGDGMLLIDEVENGLHYSIQSKLWEIIFETAQKLNVQVFATTHSYDCVQAFQRVADDYKDEEGMVVQLRRKRTEPKKIVAVTVDEKELQDAIRFQVDPR